MFTNYKQLMSYSKQAFGKGIILSAYCDKWNTCNVYYGEYYKTQTVLVFILSRTVNSCVCKSKRICRIVLKKYKLR